MLPQAVPKKKEKKNKEGNCHLGTSLPHRSRMYYCKRHTQTTASHGCLCIRDTQVGSSAAVPLLEMEADGPHLTTRHTEWGMAGIQALFLHPHTLTCSQTWLYCGRRVHLSLHSSKTISQRNAMMGLTQKWKVSS